MRPVIFIFDLDGTLLDSDSALVAPFVALGVPAEAVTFGHVVAEECARLGVDLGAYLAAYDPSLALPYPGVPELLATLDQWAVCSNKDGPIARSELARLGWEPAVALFADSFGGAKHLGPVLDALRATPGEVLFVGDTVHDARCAADAGCRFAWAGWNPRVPADAPGHVLREPSELLAYR